MIKKRSEADLLSNIQLQFWYDWQKNPDTPQNNTYIFYKLTGKLGVKHFANSVNTLLKEHELFRTRFYIESNEPKICCDDKTSSEIQLVDLEALHSTSSNEDKQIIYSYLEKPINLLSFPNYAIYLFTSHKRKTFYFLAIIPHILIDATSCHLLLNRLSNIYNGSHEKKPLSTKHLSLPTKPQDKEYWVSQFDKREPGIAIHKNVCATNKKFNSKRLITEISGNAVKELKSISKSNGITIFLLFTSVYALALHRYSSQKSISILYPVDIRDKKQKKLLGCNINLIPMAIDFRLANETFGDYLKKIVAVRHQDKQHQKYLYSSLINNLKNLQNRKSENFCAVISPTIFYNHHFSLDEVHIENLPVTIGSTGYDTSLVFDIENDKLRLGIEYNANKYSEGLIKQIFEYIIQVLSNLKSVSHSNITDILKLSPVEEKQILNYSTTSTIRKQYNHLYDSLYKISVQHSDQIAIQDEKKSLTYQQMLTESSKLADYLTVMGVKRGQRVAIDLTRSCEYIIAIIALVKLGCTYIPIDNKTPDLRKRYIYKDSSADFVIQENAQLTSIYRDVNITPIPIIPGIKQQPIDSKQIKEYVRCKHKDAMYIIYTSGTTGKPKGVPISYEALLSLFLTTSKLFKFDHKDIWSLSHNLSFDFSVWEIWGALLHGAQLHIISDKIRLNIRSYYQYICREKITVLNQTPSSFTNFSSLDLELNSKNHLRYIIFGGEKLNFSYLKPWVDRHGDQQPLLINMYGLTEATIHTSYHRIKACDLTSNESCIGAPLSGSAIFILNDSKTLVPKGVEGEIYISSDRITRGYLNRPKENEVSFTKLSINNKIYRAYRTKDRGYWNDKGNLIYLNREDSQIQFYGYRIELDEINHVLQKLSYVDHVISLLHKPDIDHQFIATFCVVRDKSFHDKGKIVRFMRSYLPEYMMPSEIFFINTAPLTASGKIDFPHLRNMLLENPDQSPIHTHSNNDVRKRIAKIWRNILAISDINNDINFFDAGGNSIQLSKLHYTIESEYKITINLNDLINFPTISAQASFLSAKLSGTKDKSNNNHSIKPLKATKTNKKEDIAVIGISLKLPDADNANELWENLVSSKESIKRFTKKELLQDNHLESEESNTHYIPAKGYIKDAEYFDARFFEFTDKEAELLDPQHRVFLECTQNALEDAAYYSENNTGKVGVFATQSQINNYLYKNLLRNEEAKNLFSEYQMYLNNGADFLASRISYKFNFTGPSTTIQTGCSSSLVALCTACKSLLNYDCDMAVAGGVTLSMPLKSGYLYQEGMILSPDGHCRPFDTKANGTVPSNGAVVVVLKRLEEAIQSRDHIYGVVKGFSFNNDGAVKIGYTSPSKQGQIEVIQQAFHQANIKPESVDYIEAHGTGTKLGDPIELSALDEAFKKRPSKKPYLLGSIKSNIGHLDVTSGLAGFVKALLCIKNKKIAPTVNFNQLNTNLKSVEEKFDVVKKPYKWSSHNTPRRACVSSFGMGGTNAHVIVEEYNSIEKILEKTSSSPHLLLFSAKSRSALYRLTKDVLTHIGDSETLLADAAFTLQVGRKHHHHRAFYISKSEMKTEQSLRSNLSTQIKPDKPMLCFMFPGQGCEYIKMGNTLYEKFGRFKEQFDLCANQITSLCNYDIRSFFLMNDPKSSQKYQEMNQLYIFSLEYSLAQLLMSYGIHPDVMIGHSLGEYVAACIAKIWSLKETLSILQARQSYMNQLPIGTMISISSSADKIAPILSGVSIASINAPNRCVVSGEKKDIQRVIKWLEEHKIRYKILNVNHAYHSAHLDEIYSEFLSHVEKFTMKNPAIPIMSTVNNNWLCPDNGPKYWASQMRETVQFYHGIKKLQSSGEYIFLELGPNIGLSTFVKQCNPNHNTISTLANNNDEHLSLLNCIGNCWTYGVPIDWEVFNEGNAAKRASLPTYPFDRKRYWIEPNSKPDSLNRPSSEEVYESCWDFLEINENITSKNSTLYLIYAPHNDHCNKIATALNNHWDNCLIINTSKNNNISSPKNCARIGKASVGKENICIVYMDQFETHGSLNISTINDGIHSTNQLISILHTIRKINLSSHIQINYLTNGLYKVNKDDYINPVKQLIYGPLLSAGSEYMNLNAKIIDIPIDMLQKDFTRTLNSITKELDYPSSHAEIAYRFNKRLIKKYAEVSLNDENIPPFKENGNYLIVGGLGHIGLTLANSIASTINCNLILLQRSEFPHKAYWNSPNLSEKMKNKVKKLHDIEKAGSSVYLYNADVSDKHHLNVILSKIIEKHGKIDGIIHSASQREGKIIDKIKRSDILTALRTKVMGALNLHNFFSSKDLDFMVFCSAISALRGDFGQSLYNSANSFLNALAEWRSTNYGFTLAINWDAWKEGGMAYELNESMPQLGHLENGLSDNAAKEFFKKVMGRNWSQVVIASQKTSLSPSTNSSQNLSHSSDHNNSSHLQLINMLKDIWTKYLGLKNISVDENYFSLGGDSLMGVQIIAEISKQTNIPFQPNILINYSTISSLANYILSLPNEQSKFDKSLIPLSPISADNRNIFFIHPIGGTIYIYRDISNHIDKSINFYALQCDISVLQKEEPSSITSLASCYISIIQKTQPSGPYYLGGASFGGTVAYEMAQQLVLSGHAVNNLLMIDTPSHKNLPALKAQDSDILAYLLEVASGHQVREDFYNLNLDDQLEYFLKHSKNISSILSDKNLDILKIYLSVFKSNMEQMKLYVPKAYLAIGNVCYIKAKDHDQVNSSTPESGWLELIPKGKLSLHQVPGNHITMLVGSHAINIAKIVNESMNGYSMIDIMCAT